MAEPEDTNAIYGMVQDTIKIVYPKYYLPEIVDMFCEYHNKENISEDIKSEITYVLLENNKIIGTGTIKENHITRVYVLPDFQGKGYQTIDHGRYMNYNGDCPDMDNFYPMTAFDESGVVGHLIMRFTESKCSYLRLNMPLTY